MIWRGGVKLPARLKFICEKCLNLSESGFSIDSRDACKCGHKQTYSIAIWLTYKSSTLAERLALWDRKIALKYAKGYRDELDDLYDLLEARKS